MEITNDSVVYDNWWESLDRKEKIEIMLDRMTRSEKNHLRRIPVSPDQFWNGKNVAQKHDIHHRFLGIYPGPKPSKSKSNKTKRGVKK